MLQLKVIGGTPKSGKSICHSCKCGAVVRGENGEERIICDGGMFRSNTGNSGLVTFKVYDCDRYHPYNMPWLNEMEKMAWIIEARKRGPRGFEPENEMEVVVRKPSEDSNTPQPTQAPCL